MGMYPPVIPREVGGRLLGQPRVLAQEDELQIEPSSVVGGQHARAKGAGRAWPRQHLNQPLIRFPAPGDDESGVFRSGP